MWAPFDATWLVGDPAQPPIGLDYLEAQLVGWAFTQICHELARRDADATLSSCGDIVEMLTTLRHAVMDKRTAAAADALAQRLARRAADAHDAGLVTRASLDAALGRRWTERRVAEHVVWRAGGRPTVHGLPAEGGGAPRHDALRTVDPYYRGRLDAIIGESVLQHVEDLDAIACALPGLARADTLAEGAPLIARTKNVISRELGRLLTSPHGDDARELQALLRACDQHVVLHVQRVKAALRDEADALQAMTRLASRVADLETMDRFVHALQEVEALVTLFVAGVAPLTPTAAGSAATTPSDAGGLADVHAHLLARGACASELAEVFDLRLASSIGLTAVPLRSAPPASFGVRADVLARWLARHVHAVREACVAGIGLRRRLVALPPSAPEWAGVVVERCAPDPTPEAGLAHRVRAWPPPPHLAPVAPLASASLAGAAVCVRVRAIEPTTPPVASRAVRLYSMVFEALRLGLLPCETWHVRVVLPLASRIASETSISFRAFLDENGLRDVLRRDQEYQRKQKRRCQRAHACAPTTPTTPVSSAPTPTPTPTPASPASSAPMGPPPIRPPPPASPSPSLPASLPSSVPPSPSRASARAATPVQASTMDASLFRDHAILVALRQLLRTRRGAVRIGLDDLARTTRAVSPAFAQTSARSLNMVASRVCRRVVRECEAAAQAQAARGAGAPKGTIAYSSLRAERRMALKRVVDGLVADAPGATRLAQCVESCIERMRAEPQYEHLWHDSRGAMTDARKFAATAGRTL